MIRGLSFNLWANGRLSLNKVFTLFLRFKQNQAISVILVSIKAPEMT